MQGMDVILPYEQALSRALLERLEGVPGVHIWGLTDPDRIDERVPTVSFTVERREPRQVAERLAARGINVWDGNFYALAVTERLGLEPRGGLVRVGLVHYNTVEELDRFEEALRQVASDEA